MSDAVRRRRPDDAEPGFGRSVLLIMLTGIILGLAYNYIGLHSRRSWGLDWIGQDRLAQLATMEPVAGDGEPAPSPPSYVSDDPLAIPGAAPVAAALPQIPDIGRPVEIYMDAVKQYHDADAAMIVDARDAEEYAEGHIAGAVNLPHDVAATDPTRLERFDPGGRPIVTYYGGGNCEVSLNLAYELLSAGHHQVAVYMGGFGEWELAGYPVERSAPVAEGSS